MFRVVGFTLERQINRVRWKLDNHFEVALEMAARVEINEDTENNQGSMWVLDQKLDQPMDEEAGRLRNMYREKVRCNCLFDTLSISTSDR